MPVILRNGSNASAQLALLASHLEHLSELCATYSAADLMAIDHTVQQLTTVIEGVDEIVGGTPGRRYHQT